jgi:hypothetical protein
LGIFVFDADHRFGCFVAAQHNDRAILPDDAPRLMIDAACGEHLHHHDDTENLGGTPPEWRSAKRCSGSREAEKQLERTD